MSVVDDALAAAFSQYLVNISLNPTREKKIRHYAASVTRYVQEEDGRALGKYVQVEPFIHGSYSYNTAVRPRKGGEEYDLDMILPLSREFFEAYGPNNALGYVRQRLSKKYWNVSQGNKCVRISYEDGFHVDLVPAYVPDGNTSVVQIVDRRTGEFVKSHPVAVTDWVTDLNRNTSHRFSATVRILKRWRDIKFGAQNRPKSLLLTVLAGRAIEFTSQTSETRAFFASPATSLASFVQGSARAMDLYLDHRGPEILVPGTHDDLGENWSRPAQAAFGKKLDYFSQTANKANGNSTRRGALLRWSKVLGTDFPLVI